MKFPTDKSPVIRRGIFSIPYIYLTAGSRRTMFPEGRARKNCIEKRKWSRLKVGGNANEIFIDSPRPDLII